MTEDYHQKIPDTLFIDEDDETLENENWKENIPLNTRKIVNTVLKLEAKVVDAVKMEGDQLDPNGWSIFAFDSSKYTPEQVMDEIDISDTLEISFTEKKGRKRFILSDYQASSSVLQGNVIHPIDPNERDSVDLRLPVDRALHANDYQRPEIVCNSEKGTVLLVNVLVEDAERAVKLGSRTLNEIADRLRDADSRYHFRVFGNSAGSSQKRRFIFAERSQITDTQPTLDLE